MTTDDETWRGLLRSYWPLILLPGAPILGLLFLLAWVVLH